MTPPRPRKRPFHFKNRASAYPEVKRLGDWPAGHQEFYGEFYAWLKRGGYQEQTVARYGSAARVVLGLMDQPACQMAEADLARAKPLLGGNVISQQVFDQRTQAKRVAEANVAAQEAAVKQAALDLDFTELRAPVSGRIGDRRVSIGNLVMGGTTGETTLLATIESTDPIRFEFTADEGSYLRYVRMAGNREDINNAGKVPVELKLLDEQVFSHPGRMDFVDNAIDTSSGTIRARAVFPNPNGTFTPGMFGRIQVATGPPAEALLVPDSAIGTEQVKKFVLVVDDQDTAQAKYVTLGPVVDGLRVVQSGLDAGDRVVVNGLMRVRPGIKVSPQLSTASTSEATRAAAD